MFNARAAMKDDRKLYNALAYLVTMVRQTRADIANPVLTEYNLEDLEAALKKSEELLVETDREIAQ